MTLPTEQLEQVAQDQVEQAPQPMAEQPVPAQEPIEQPQPAQAPQPTSQPASQPAVEQAPPSITTQYEIFKYIAEHESRGSYNATNGGTRGGEVVGADYETMFDNVLLSDMTLAQVLERQDKNEILAAGKYQVIASTLRQGMKALGLDPSEKYSAATQDRLGEWLLTKKREIVGEWFNNQDKDINEVLLELAKEFAFLPVPYDVTKTLESGTIVHIKKGESYYKNTGNVARGKLEDITRLVEAFRKPIDEDKTMVEGTEAVVQPLETTASGDPDVVPSEGNALADSSTDEQDYLSDDEPDALDQLGVEESPTTGVSEPLKDRMAVYSALLDSGGENAVDSFHAVRESMETGNFEPVDESLTRIGEGVAAAKEAATVSVLSDDGVGLPTRQAAAQAFADQSGGDQESVEKTFAVQQIAEPVDGETEEEARLRELVALVLDPVIEAEQEITSVLTAVVNRDNVPWYKDIANFVGLIAPFVQQADVANLREVLHNAIEGEDYTAIQEMLHSSRAWGALGFEKKDIRDVLATLPPEEKVPAVKALLAAMESNAGVLGKGANEWYNATLAREFLEHGFHGDGSILLDQVVAMLDLSFIGSITLAPVVRALRTPAALKANARAWAGLAPLAQARPRIVRLPEELAPTPLPTQIVIDAPPVEQVLASAKAELTSVAKQALPNPVFNRLTQELKEIANHSRSLKTEEYQRSLIKEIQKVDKLTISKATKLAKKEIADDVKQLAVRTKNVEQQLADHAAGVAAKEDLRLIKTGVVPKRFKLANVGAQKLVKRNPIAEAMSRATEANIAGKIDPLSPLGIAAKTNPSVARGLFSAAMSSDNAAKILGARTREEIYADFVLPKMASQTARATAPIGDIDHAARVGAREEANISDIHTPSSIHYTAGEKTAARARVVEDTSSATDLFVRESHIGEFVGTKLPVSATYGASADSGFLKIDDAIATAKFRLRNYGIDLEDLTILARSSDGTLVEVDKTALKNFKDVDGDYFVKVDFDYVLNPKDALGINSKSVHFKWADKLFAQMRKPISGFLADSSSRFDFFISGGYARGIQKSDKLETDLLNILRGRFTGQFGKALSHASKTKILELAKEGNRLRKNMYDPEKLKNDGWTPAELDGLKDWYRFWDVVWHLDNQDLIRTVNASGGMKLAVQSNGFHMTVDPVGKSGASALGVGTHYYDPLTDTMRTLNGKELDALYEAGGSIVKLRTPIIETLADGSKVSRTHAIAEKNIDVTYRTYDGSKDHLLNYIDGYFPVKYKDEFFILKQDLDKSGKVINTTVVGTAPSAGAARLATKRLTAKGDDTVSYGFRPDNKIDLAERDAFREMQAVGTGRSSQRFRGERLHDVTSDALADAPIQDPLSTALETARGMADRVALRDVTESMKARFLNEYSDTLTLPRDANGRPTFPSEPNQVSKIGRAGMETDDDVIAARSLVDYINMIENVQSTFLDRVYQSAFRLFADAIEGSGESAIRQKIGAGARAAGRAEPIREAKLLAFKVYLASNPPRQVLVQSHQISQLTIRDPVRAADVLFTQFPAILALKAGQDLGLVSKQFAVSEDSLKRILKEWDESGIGQGVDSNMLVDGSVKAFERDLVANPVAKVGSTAIKTINAPFRAGQVLGFNAGEYAQQMMHWLFQRQKWIDENPNMLPDVDALDTIAAETAMTTYNMNRSGKMKYQDGLLGVLLQFLTVGHRAGLSMTTNKALTRGERIRLGIGNLALYGTQTMPIVGHITEEIVTSIAEKNGYELTQEERDLMQYGLEEAGWKALIEWWTGESFDSDLVGSLAPGSYSGWMDIIDKIMSKELLEWGFGPAGSFMPFSEGSKPAKVWTQLRVLFGDEQTSTVDKTMSTLDILGKNFFGAYSNITQALLALEDGKLKSNTNGTVLVDDVTTPEAIALAVGIRPRRGQEAYKARKEVADRANALRSDVRKYLQAIHAVFDSANPESVPDTLNRFARIMTDVWGQDPDVQYDVQVMLMEELKKELRKDPANSAINKLLQYHNLFSTEEVLRKLHVLGMPKEAIADWQAVIKNARVGMAEQDVPPSRIKSYGPITVDQRNK